MTRVLDGNGMPKRKEGDVGERLAVNEGRRTTIEQHFGHGTDRDDWGHQVEGLRAVV